MKKVLFERIAILSLTEQKAFSFDFSEGLNFIHGANDTGKSSLIKSLYYCLGGDVRLDEGWKSQEMITKVTLVYDGKTINFLRKASFFIVSIIEDGLVTTEKKFNKISELATEIQIIFGFNLLLTVKRNKETVLAYPATYYFPFYIDQDGGWGHALGSFNGLTMYDDWQKNALQYHSGIKPKEYYSLNGEQKILAAEIAELEKEEVLIKKTKSRFEQHLYNVRFDIDLEYYVTKIDYFVRKCEELEAEEREFRFKALDLYSKRNSLSDALFNIENENNNILIDDLDDISYSIKKYEINKSKISLFSQKARIYEEKIKIDEKIANIKEKLFENKNLSKKINSMLSDVHDKFSVKEIIDSEAYKTAAQAFDKQLSELKEVIDDLLLKKTSIEEEIKKFNNSKRTKEINGFFLLMLNKVQSKLQIQVSSKATVIGYKMLTTGKTGSRSPRAIFAYHYALLMTISKFSSLPILPIVIDSPKQQDLDDDYTEKVIQLCLDDLAEISQVIIGAVKPERNMAGYHSINLNEKLSLLNKDKYQDIYDEIIPIFNRNAFD